jgi:hypothetical protein
VKGGIHVVRGYAKGKLKGGRKGSRVIRIEGKNK